MDDEEPFCGAPFVAALWYPCGPECAVCDPLQDTMVSMFERRNARVLARAHLGWLARPRSAQRFVSCARWHQRHARPATLFDHDERELVVHPLPAGRARHNRQPSALFTRAPACCKSWSRTTLPRTTRDGVYTTMCLNCWAFSVDDPSSFSCHTHCSLRQAGRPPKHLQNGRGIQGSS